MNVNASFVAHSLSKGLTERASGLSRAALTRTGFALALVACALPFALRLLLLLVPANAWPAYVLLFVVALALLALLTEVNYFGRAWYLTLLYAVSATALTLLSWNGHSNDVLEARGRWTEVTVVQITERPRRDTVCELRRTDDGTAVPHLLDDCADLSRGATLSVLEDPEGEVRPRRSAPNTVATDLAAGISAVVLVTGVTVAFRRGGRRHPPMPPPYPPSTNPGQPYPQPGPGSFSGPHDGRP
ncbi:hypothetical protein [Streptomyces sp. OM5714]|uniref:hypothetical protein n=1 Tax=Streptomyces TaxID=1883 RepID=UPI0013DC74FC|nr:hypothetical protein [Streptomyces sp. OM5714]